VRAVDTNLLVFAEITSSRYHSTALGLLTELAGDARLWASLRNWPGTPASGPPYGAGRGRPPLAIPWPCVCEFLRVVTHPRVFHPPVPMDRASLGLGGSFALPPSASWLRRPVTPPSWPRS
jgi:uncharacterized protein